jgi:hypothetical protein
MLTTLFINNATVRYLDIDLWAQVWYILLSVERTSTCSHVLFNLFCRLMLYSHFAGKWSFVISRWNCAESTETKLSHFPRSAAYQAEADRWAGRWCQHSRKWQDFMGKPLNTGFGFRIELKHSISPTTKTQSGRHSGLFFTFEWLYIGFHP